MSSDAIEKSLSGLNYYLEEENEEKEVEGEEGEEAAEAEPAALEGRLWKLASWPRDQGPRLQRAGGGRNLRVI